MARCLIHMSARAHTHTHTHMRARARWTSSEGVVS